MHILVTNYISPNLFTGKCKKWKKRLLAAVFTLGLILTTGSGLSMIVLASIESSSIAPSMKLYGNTTVALGNVQKFTTRHVTLSQVPGRDEVYIPLTFYHSSDGCNSLPTKPSKMDPVTNQTVPLHPHMVIFRGYLMPESVLNYSFCAVTNQLSGTKFHIDFYIAEDLDENLHFDPQTYRFSLHQDIALAHDPNLLPTDNCTTTITHSITKRGPYSVVLFPPLQSEVPFSNISMWYSQNNHIRVIEISHLKQECTISNAEHCKISVGSLQHYISVFCVVVKVGDSNYDNFTSVNVSLADYDVGKIWFFVVGGFIVAIYSSIFVIFIALLCKCRRF